MTRDTQPLNIQAVFWCITKMMVRVKNFCLCATYLARRWLYDPARFLGVPNVPNSAALFRVGVRPAARGFAPRFAFVICLPYPAAMLGSIVCLAVGAFVCLNFWAQPALTSASAAYFRMGFMICTSIGASLFSVLQVMSGANWALAVPALGRHIAGAACLLGKFRQRLDLAACCAVFKPLGNKLHSFLSGLFCGTGHIDYPFYRVYTRIGGVSNYTVYSAPS